MFSISWLGCHGRTGEIGLGRRAMCSYGGGPNLLPISSLWRGQQQSLIPSPKLKRQCVCETLNEIKGRRELTVNPERNRITSCFHKGNLPVSEVKVINDGSPFIFQMGSNKFSSKYHQILGMINQPSQVDGYQYNF